MIVFELLFRRHMDFLVVAGLRFYFSRGLLLQHLRTIVVGLLLLMLPRGYSGVFHGGTLLRVLFLTFVEFDGVWVFELKN